MPSIFVVARWRDIDRQGGACDSLRIYSFSGKALYYPEEKENKIKYKREREKRKEKMKDER
jgi:hypothetical protein